jgi:hypothetical protein
MSRQPQARKESLLADLVAARSSVLAAAMTLSPAQRDEVFLGTWSVKDLLAHLAGWDFANLEAAQAILAGRRPAFWAHQDHDWRAFNACLVAEYRREDFGELLALLEDSHRRLIAFLETIPAAELFQAHGRDRISTLLRTETRDEFEHGRQILELAAQSRARTERP